jgi:putative acetyltransferase
MREDTFAMWYVHTLAVKVLCGSGYTVSEIQAWIADDTPEKYRFDLGRGCTMFVAQQGGEVLGFSSLFGDEIEALYVHPAYIRKKAGEMLLHVLENVASGRQVGMLYLDAAVTARRFYETCGCEITGYSTPVFDTGIEHSLHPHGEEARTIECGARDLRNGALGL